jgi:hypothetical protein
MNKLSWRTADTSYDITERHPVYMLMPDGNHVCEDHYCGDHHFGGINALEWLATENASQFAYGKHLPSRQRLEAIGNFLVCGKVYLHCSLGEVVMSENFTDVIPGVVLQHSEIEKLLKDHAIVEFKLNTMLVRPLKFSFNACADYYRLPGSDVCEYRSASEHRQPILSVCL